MLSVIDHMAAWVPLGLPAYIFVITVVVFFHELGHFAVARLCGVKVETFSIGFGRAIVGWTDRRGTHWKISWIPFGGYVKFFGDADAASTPDRETASQMSEEERKDAFPFKPLWQRALVVAAGPFANFILAIVIFAATLMAVGRASIPPIIHTVVPHSAAYDAGIRPGDVVRAIDGRKIADFGDLPEIVSMSAGESLAVTLERKGRLFTVNATPRPTTVSSPLGPEKTVALGISVDAPPVVASVLPGSPAARAGFQANDRIIAVNSRNVRSFTDIAAATSARLGKPVAVAVQRNGEMLTLHAVPLREGRYIQHGTMQRTEVMGLVSEATEAPVVVYYGPLAALGAGADQTWMIAKGTLGYIWQAATGRADLSQLRGPIGVAGVAQKIAVLGFLALVQLAALMSVSIGLVNLFPIPLLDGGHLLYYAFEAVLGRPLGERAQDFGFRVGLAVVLGLMILVTWNDLARLNLF